MCALFLFSSWQAPPFPFSFLPLRTSSFLFSFLFIYFFFLWFSLLPCLYLLFAFFFIRSPSTQAAGSLPSTHAAKPSCSPLLSLTEPTITNTTSSLLPLTKPTITNPSSSLPDWTHNQKPNRLSSSFDRTHSSSPWPNPKTHSWNPSAHLKTEDSREGIWLPFGSGWSSMGINNGLLGFGLG